MSSLFDINGKAIGQLFIKIAVSPEGEGWIEYSWPKPDEEIPSTKDTYIKGVSFGNQNYLVGSGLYIEGFEDAFVVPLKYVAIVIEGVIAATGLFLAVG